MSDRIELICWVNKQPTPGTIYHKASFQSTGNDTLQLVTTLPLSLDDLQPYTSVGHGVVKSFDLEEGCSAIFLLSEANVVEYWPFVEDSKQTKIFHRTVE
jgi:hypothetical protein